MITLNEIQEARGRFEGHVTETPHFRIFHNQQRDLVWFAVAGTCRAAADLERLHQHTLGGDILHPPVFGRARSRHELADHACDGIRKFIEVEKNDPCHGREVNGPVQGGIKSSPGSIYH